MVLIYIVIGIIGSVVSDPSLEGINLILYFLGFVLLALISGVFAFEGIRNGEGAVSYILLVVNILIIVLALLLLYIFGFADLA